MGDPVRQRDEEFTEFVLTRSTRLMGTALRLCAGDRTAAEDLVQTTLTRAYTSWHRVKDPNARDAYVRRIMVRTSWAAPRRSTLPLDSVAEPVAAATPDEVGDRSLLWPLLRSLPRQQRAVLVLRYYLDLSEVQIADALGCSPGAVKSHSSRALAKLRADARLLALKEN